MKLSKKGELLALGSALHLVGIEMEAHRDKLWEMSEHAVNGAVRVTPELIEHLDAFNQAKSKFAQLEKQFLKLCEKL